MAAQAVSVLYEGFARVNGFVNGCGQAATLMMTSLVRGQPVNTNDLANALKLTIVTGHATASGSHIGSTNPQDLQWLAEQQGVKTTLGSGNNWQSTVDAALAQGKPVVLGLNNARALGGSDANVSGHYVTVISPTGDGKYVVADPNQQAAKTGGTVIYSRSQIQAAQPFATLTPTQAAANSTASSGNPQYSVSLFPGNTTNLDPLVDGIIRASLIIIGVTLIVIALLIFTRPDKAIAANAPQIEHAAEVAAA